MNVEPDIHAEPIRRHSPSRHAPDMLEPPVEWMNEAACLEYDADTWYPEGKGATATDAKKICRGCSVVGVCLAYALANRESAGIWGVKSPREREVIRRRQRRGAA